MFHRLLEALIDGVARDAQSAADLLRRFVLEHHAQAGPLTLSHLRQRRFVHKPCLAKAHGPAKDGPGPDHGLAFSRTPR